MLTTLYPYTNRDKEPIPDHAATLEHLDSRLNPNRGQHYGEIRQVIACYKCNQERNDQEHAQLPIEEKWARSKRHRL